MLETIILSNDHYLILNNCIFEKRENINIIMYTNILVSTNINTCEYFL